MQRSPTNLHLWVEFTALTLAVTGVSLVLGLLIRGLVADEPHRGTQVVELMQVEQTPFTTIPAVAVVDRIPQAVETTLIEPPQPKPQINTMTFDGRPIRPVRTTLMTVTAYSPDVRSCGKWADGKTASGYSVWTNGMKLVAADTSILPFDTIMTVPGYNGGDPVQVLDRGGKIKGHRLDVLYPTHAIARQWGSQSLSVTIWEYAD